MLAATHSTTRHCTLAIVCALLAAGCNRSETTGRRPARANAALHVDSSGGDVSQYSLMTTPIGWLTDSNIVALVSMVNDAPMSLARAESQSWTDQQVHDFALEIIRDHAAFQTSVDSLMGKRRIPPQLPAVAESMRPMYDSLGTRLAGLPASEVDKRFLALEDSIHTHTSIDFGALGGNAADPDLRAMLAIRATDMEQRHLARSRDMALSIAKADSAKRVAKDSAKVGRKRQ